MNRLTPIFLILLSPSIFALEKSICGIDDRVPSQDPKVGRALYSETADNACTVTMISNNCAISVGHCNEYFKLVEFNTPASDKEGLNYSAKEDVYKVDESTIVYSNAGPGNDWAVMKLLPNIHTEYAAGQVQGFYELDYTVPESKALISITGHGYDVEVERSFAQQNGIGYLESVGRTGVIRHKVDTTGGNSGSSIINLKSGKIIGVHSHGGCSRSHFSNATNLGTSVATNLKFKKAIQACLDTE
ncbi:trypsin [Bacteriovorax sp. BAL6_X]|uniref:trypsin-like serine peptidase n=1 Tax=Bacteriovorax sp. BAL6_X TaxID=1201290 RepID=UPI0003868085|nr:trypsin-like serine protease [Bacteriovorax sp. BAL6_X]EPZ50663.1 trypsin [Bacteriovorax sp. BAL6_X]